jgi:putative membrane protein
MTAQATDLLALCLALLPAATPQNWLTQWSLAPAIVIPLMLMVCAYGRALRLERSRPSPLALAGFAILALALVSPLCRIAATLASVHMLQFMLLAIVAPATIAAALLRGVTGFERRLAAWLHRQARALGIMTALYGGLIWLLHAPPVYAATLTDPVIHVAATCALVAVSLGWFLLVFAQARSRPGQVTASVFLTMVHTGLLGAILTFTPDLLYPLQADGATAWGLAPLADQQLAGLIMWVVGNLAYLIVGLALILRGLNLSRPVINPTR